MEWTARPPIWIPAEPTLINYKILFGLAPFKPFPEFVPMWISANKAMLNSLVIVGCATLIAVLLGYLAAWSASRHGTGGRFAFLSIIAPDSFPSFILAIPLLILFSTLHMLDTHIALILLYGGVEVAFTLWILKSYIDYVPVEIEESAKMDGCSNFSIIFRVTLPLLKGGLVTACLYTFSHIIGEYFFALVLTRSEAITVPVQLAKYAGTSAGTLFGPIAALGTVTIIPAFIFGYFVKNYLLKGLQLMTR
jgi:multiple sugar transport system permease protein